MAIETAGYSRLHHDTWEKDTDRYPEILNGIKWRETASSQWRHLIPFDNQGRPLVVRDREQSLNYQGRPSVVRESQQSLAIL